MRYTSHSSTNVHIPMNEQIESIKKELSSAVEKAIGEFSPLLMALNSESPEDEKPRNEVMAYLACLEELRSMLSGK